MSFLENKPITTTTTTPTSVKINDHVTKQPSEVIKWNKPVYLELNENGQ
ncbi:unnamed protein product, partial [Rotaria sp. Silwood2]